MEPKQEEHDLPVPGELSLFSGMTLMGTFSDTPDNAGVGKNAQESEGVSGSLSTEFQEVFAGLTVLQTKTGSSTEDSTFPPRTLEKTPTSTNDAKPHLAQDSETLSTAVHSCTTRKKKRSQAKRPGYAREADSQNVPSITTSNQKESLTEPSTRENTEEDNSSSRLYSIGTPSSSEDELVKPDEQDIPYQGPEDVEADNKQFDKSIISKTNEEGTLDIGACPELTANLENNVIKKGEIIGDASKEGTFVENKDATSDVSCNDDSDDLHHVDETNNEDNIHGYDNRHNTSFVYYDEPSDEDVTESLRVEDHEKYSKKSLASYEIDLSPDELFAIHEEGVQHKISSIREKMTVIEDMESQLVTLYSNSECVLDKYRKELQDLHNKEIDALANDNYDLAEEISSKIEGLESLIESTKYQLPFTDDKVQDALSLRREVTSHAISVHQDVLESMHTLHDEQAKILSVRRHDSSTKLLQEKQRLNSERNRIQRALGHVELDKGHLSTEQQQIRDDIRQRTEGFTARRDELVQQRDDVKEQIAELERQLDVLRSQEMRFTQEIKEEEERIETIVAEFSPQLTLLQDQQCHLEIQRIQLETDKESLAREEESFDVSSKEWQRENQRFEDLLSDVNGSITKTEQTIKDLEGWQKEVELFMKCKHLTFPVNSELDSLRKSSKKLALQIKSLKTRLHLSEKTATSLRKRVNEIEELVSARDEAKEIAKKERNFKEAKRLKEERDQLAGEGGECQMKLENFLEQQVNDKSELKSCEREQHELLVDVHDMQKENDLKLLTAATRVKNNLENILPSLCGNPLLSALVKAEMKTCQAIQAELCSKHDVEADCSSLCDEREEENPMGSEQNCQKNDTIETIDKKLTTRLGGLTWDELHGQLDELEGKLEAVVDMEDFDEADRIQQEIDRLNELIKTIEST